MLAKSWIPGVGKSDEITSIIVPSIRYAIGMYDGTAVGMCYGPFLSIQDALEIIPSDNNSCLFMLSDDQNISVLLYKWRNNKSSWHLLNKEYHWLYHPESECVFLDILDDTSTVTSECIDLGVARNFDQDELNKIYISIYDRQNLIFPSKN